MPESAPGNSSRRTRSRRLAIRHRSRKFRRGALALHLNAFQEIFTARATTWLRHLKPLQEISTAHVGVAVASECTPRGDFRKGRAKPKCPQGLFPKNRTKPKYPQGLFPERLTNARYFRNPRRDYFPKIRFLENTPKDHPPKKLEGAQRSKALQRYYPYTYQIHTRYPRTNQRHFKTQTYQRHFKPTALHGPQPTALSKKGARQITPTGVNSVSVANRGW